MKSLLLLTKHDFKWKVQAALLHSRGLVRQLPTDFFGKFKHEAHQAFSEDQIWVISLGKPVQLVWLQLKILAL